MSAERHFRCSMCVCVQTFKNGFQKFHSGCMYYTQDSIIQWIQKQQQKLQAQCTERVSCLLQAKMTEQPMCLVTMNKQLVPAWLQCQNVDLKSPFHDEFLFYFVLANLHLVCEACPMLLFGTWSKLNLCLLWCSSTLSTPFVAQDVCSIPCNGIMTHDWGWLSWAPAIIIGILVQKLFHFFLCPLESRIPGG